MDIYEYLKTDHKKVDTLFKQFEQATIQNQKVEIVGKIIKELLVHAESEENTFYKWLEKYQDAAPVSRHGKKEHDEIKSLIEHISNLKVLGEAWSEKVLELKEAVEHHVKDEEGPMFSKAKQNLSEEDARIIKEKMEQYKDKLMRTEPTYSS